MSQPPSGTDILDRIPTRAPYAGKPISTGRPRKLTAIRIEPKPKRNRKVDRPHHKLGPTITPQARLEKVRGAMRDFMGLCAALKLRQYP